VYRPEREVAVLRRIQSLNQGPLPDESIARLFREVMSECLALERPLTIAYLGPQGTFTQQAAIKHFGHAAHTAAFQTIDQCFLTSPQAFNAVTASKSKVRPTEPRIESLRRSHCPHPSQPLA